jgi:hypothetical protein
MRNDKTMILALLDFCAFAVTQVPDEKRGEAQAEFDFAYRLAEESLLEDIESYRELTAAYRRREIDPAVN